VAHQWTSLLPGKDGTANNHFRSWGKPVYAAADGTVTDFANHIRYAAIFEKSPGPAFSVYHGRTADEHQNLFDTWTKDGWRPVNVSVVAPGGARTYAALYEKKDVGGFWVKSFLTPAEYQTQFDQNVNAGRHLSYVNGYSFSGTPRLIAIWQEKPAVALIARHGMTANSYQTEFDQHHAEGFWTRAVTGYEEGGGARFAAFWTK